MSSVSRPRPGPYLLGPRGHAALLAGCAVAGVALVLVGVGTGAVPVPLGDVVATLARRVFGWGDGVDLATDTIVWEYRFPRTLLAFVVGAGLSLAGVLMQALVRNPLADPYVLGVASGASAAATAAMTLGIAALAGLGIPVVAFAGAAATMVAVLALGRRNGRIDPPRMLLAGVAVGYLMAAVTSYLQLRATPEELANVLFWILGSLAGTSWSDLPVATAVVLLAAVLVLYRATALDLLSLGDDAASSLGVDLPRFRLELVLVAALCTGVAVAVAGGIGFVGLMIPHVARLLVGPAHRRVVPLSLLLGGCYLVLVDILCRVVRAPAELPVGIVTALVGAPFLIWLLRRDRGEVAG
ncbi:iron ABC transporter permease [Nocardioides caricicola]|uniref:FecCD family ABC transporter permease n=1 Tax=Nocardioides caricicola TaxID=634770 RepID=A0ABW0N6P8_9ACTN